MSFFVRLWLGVWEKVQLFIFMIFMYCGLWCKLFHSAGSLRAAQWFDSLSSIRYYLTTRWIAQSSYFSIYWVRNSCTTGTDHIVSFSISLMNLLVKILKVIPFSITFMLSLVFVMREFNLKFQGKYLSSQYNKNRTLYFLFQPFLSSVICLLPLISVSLCWK